jgi:hypothetical protein
MRDQGVGLSDMGSSANVRSNLQKYQTKQEVTTKVILK